MSKYDLSGIDALPDALPTPKAPKAPPTRYNFSGIDALPDAPNTTDPRLPFAIGAFDQSEAAKQQRYDKLATELRNYLGDEAPVVNRFTFEEAQRRMDRIEMDHLLRNAPYATKYFVDEIAKGRTPYDIKVLAGIEEVVTQGREASARVLSAAPMDVAMAPFRVVGGVLSFGGGIEDTISQIFGDVEPSLKTKLGNLLLKYAEAKQHPIPEYAGNLERGMRSGVQSGAESLLLLPAGIAARVAGLSEIAATNIVSSLMALRVGGQTYQESVAVTDNPARSFLHGLLDAVAEYIGEKYGGTGTLFKGKTWAKGWLGGLLRFIAKEVPSEVGTELTQSLNDWLITHPEKTAEEFLSEIPDTVIQTVVGTLLGGGAQVATVKGLEKVAGLASDHAAAEADAEAYRRLFDLVAQSQLLENSPETFGEFFQNVTEGDEVWVDQGLLLQTLEAAGLTPDAIPSLKEQLGAPGDVSVPVAELVPALAGTGQEKKIIENIRRSPDAPTLLEAREGLSKAIDLFNQHVERTVTRQQNTQIFEEQIKVLKEEIKADIEFAKSVPPAARDAYAALVAHGYATLASRLGITPLQVRDGWVDAQGVEHSGYNLRVLGERGMRGRIAATPADFAPGRISNILQRDNWAILTAENPMGKTLSPEENAARQEALRQKLDEMGLKYEQIEGKYAPEGEEGTAPLEHPFIVYNIDLDTARELGKAFDQESVLTRLGLVYHDGTVHRAKRVTEHKTEPENYWSRVPSTGAIFTIDLDFDKRIPLEAIDAITGQERDVRRRKRRGPAEKLEGAPSVEGAEGPDINLVRVAEKYARDHGIPFTRQSEYVKVNPDLAKRIAAAYEEMKHAPDDPVVAEAYANLIAQTRAQYEALVAAGYRFYFTKPDDPYNSNPWIAMRDLRANKTLGVFPTTAGFGSGISKADLADNPLLADTGLKWPYGSLEGEPMPVLANDLFRAVHDAFGHGLEGAGFRAQGEENAWQAHVRLYTGSAIAAMTTETRGQNSWLNFGPYGEANQKAKVEDTVFADQKTGLLPEWAWTEGIAPNEPDWEEDITPSETLDQSLSTRLPKQTKTRPDPHLRTDLAVDYSLVESIPGYADRLAAVITEYVGVKPGANGLETVEKFVQQAKDNLLWLYDHVPAEIRERSKLWYEGGRRLIDRWSEKYGYTDMQIAAVIAVLSPQTEWNTNVSRAERVLDIWTKHQNTPWSEEMDKKAKELKAVSPEHLKAIRGKTLAEIDDVIDKAVWLRVYDEAHNPKQFRIVTPEGGFSEWSTTSTGKPSSFTWGSFKEIGKAIQVLEDGSFATVSRALGNEHKVRNFYNNLYDPADPTSVTIDTHAVAAALLRPLAGKDIEVSDNLGGRPRHDPSGQYGTYVLYAEAYRRAAKERGVLPREMQSITWEAVRRLFPDVAKTKMKKEAVDGLTVIDRIWKEAKNADQARSKILEERGGRIPEPAWHGHSSGLHAGERASSYTEELLADSWDGRAIGPRTRDVFAQTVPPAGLSVTGVHYSPKKLTTVDPAMYGRGLKGAERERVMTAKDPRIKKRANFYVSTGRGVMPEAGVGDNAHLAQLNNVYDADVDPLGLFKDLSPEGLNAAESAVIDAGYSGYLRRNFGSSGAVVMFGEPIPVRHVGGRAEAEAAAPPAPAAQYSETQKMRATLLNAKDLIYAGTAENWRKALAKKYPDILARLEEVHAFDDIEGMVYRDYLARRLVPPEGELYQDTVAGSFSPFRLEISLLAEANLSTFVHEVGHFFLTIYGSVALQLEQKQQAGETLTAGEQSIIDDMYTVLAQFGVPDLATWAAMPLDEQRAHHEQFAESWEQYILTGEAPVRGLKSIFRTLSDFMARVYRSVKDFLASPSGKNAKLNPELAAVMDRMLATKEQIAEEMDRRELEAVFKDAAAAGMTPAKFAEYMALPEEVRKEAEEALRARSMRDMKWLRNRRNKILAALQAEAKEVRAKVRAEVEAEVRAEPIFQAIRWLRHGETIGPDGEEIKVLAGNKLSIPALEEMFPEGALGEKVNWRALGYGRYGMLAVEGMHPDAVAEMFGFSSGRALIDALLNAPKFTDEVEGRTDQRMLEEHSDLATPEALNAAVDEAMHNEAHIKLLATELKGLTAFTGSASQLTRAAKIYVDALIGKRTARTMRPWASSAEELRAGKAANAAMAKGDRQTAAKLKREQLINHILTKEAYKAEAEIRQIIQRLNKIASYNDESSAVKSRDAATVNALRVILRQYGIGPERRGKKAAEYLDVVKEHDPATYERLSEVISAMTDNAQDWRDVKLEDLRALHEAVNDIWSLALRSRQIEVDGKMMAIDQVEEELVAKLEEHGKPPIGKPTHAVTDAEKRALMLDTYKNAITRVETWAAAMDRGEKLGPVMRYIWSQVNDGLERYAVKKAEYLKAYIALLDTIRPTLKRGLIDAPELGYTFGKQHSGSGKEELLHAILHVGNESNKRKLLLGYEWATKKEDGSIDTSKWDAFIDRMHREGVLTKADWDFAQGVWDLLESMKPDAQKAHRIVHGRFFDEVSANEVVTPFGTYRGGYVPAVIDIERVVDAKLRALSEEENKGMAYSFPLPRHGFTKTRVEYNVPLKLDLSSLAVHIDKVLLFSHTAAPVSDLRRILRRPRVSALLNAISPGAYENLLAPWVERASTQIIETPISGAHALASIASKLRSRSGMMTMFANVANSVQQLTGFFPAALMVKPKYLLHSFALAHQDRANTLNFIKSKSLAMKERLEQNVILASEQINAIIANPNLIERAENWTMRHAYFMQQAIDNWMAPIVWLGAWNQAREEGRSEADAARIADYAVRNSLGSQRPQDLSRIETGNPFWRWFTQFTGYFNMITNVVMTEQAINQATGKSFGRLSFIVLMAILAPSIVGELILQAFRGGPPDEDKDGEYLDDWLTSVLLWGNVSYVTAMVPVVGPAVNAAISTWAHRPFGGRVANAPAITAIETTIRVPNDIANLVDGEGRPSRAIGDIGVALSLAFGLPAKTLAKPIGYWADVANEDTEPQGILDAVRGTITGVSSPESRN